MGLTEDLGQGPVALDTAIFICLMERHPRFLEALKPLFGRVEDGRLRAFTSELTLMEVLVAPLRAGDAALAAKYEAILGHSRGLTLVPLDRDLLREAARVRATTGLKTPDAIQVAAARRAGCPVLLTNDRDYRSAEGLKVLQVRDYAG